MSSAYSGRNVLFFILFPPVNSIGFVALLILEETVFVLNGTAVGLAKMQSFVVQNEKTGSAKANPVNLCCQQNISSVHSPA